MSWKKEASDRRDFKASKEDIEDKHASLKKKDTKKWCKGKIGKEHKTEVKPYKDVKVRNLSNGKSIYEGYYILFCTCCGKELEKYMPFGKNIKPDWLVKYLEANN